MATQRVRVLGLLACGLVLSCSSGTVSEESSAQGLVIKQNAQEVSTECPQGGVKLELGFDKNGNNVLDAEEILRTEWVCNGKDGAAGEAGAKGEQGDPGAKGDKGDSGLPGEPGADGRNCWDINGDGITDPEEDINNDSAWNALDCLGAPGMTGPKGDQGEAGLPGAPGAKGDAGQPGEKGETGAKGDSGAKGEKGDTGQPGEKGEAGAKGDPGAKGDKGEAGAKGDPGAKGDKGDSGLPGEPGADGRNCWDINGDGITDPEEDINSDSAWDALDCLGAPGVTGPKGDKGDKGDKGEPGTSVVGAWAQAYGNGSAVFAKNSDYVWKELGPVQGITLDAGKKIFTVTNAGVYHITYSVSVLKPVGLKKWVSVALYVNEALQAASRRSVAGGGELRHTVLLELAEGATVSLRNIGGADLFPVDSPGGAGDPGADAPSIVFVKLN